MLPRKRYRRLVCLSMATTFAASTLVSAPVQAVTGYTPPVIVNEINVTPMASSTGQQHELTCYLHQAIGGVFSGDLSQVIGCWWRAG